MSLIRRWGIIFLVCFLCVSACSKGEQETDTLTKETTQEFIEISWEGVPSGLSQNGILTNKGLLQYYDFAAEQSVVVCDKPNCEHDTVTCNGKLDNSRATFYYEGKLYYISYREMNKMALYIADKNATNRQEVLTDIPGDRIKKMLITKDGQLVICFALTKIRFKDTNVTSYGSAGENIVLIDLKQETMSVILETENIQYNSVIQALYYDNSNVYYGLERYDEDISEYVEPQVDENGNIVNDELVDISDNLNCHMVIGEINLENGSYDEIYDYSYIYKNHGMYSVFDVNDSKMYAVDYKKNIVLAINIETKEERTLTAFNQMTCKIFIDENELVVQCVNPEQLQKSEYTYYTLEGKELRSVPMNGYQLAMLIGMNNERYLFTYQDEKLDSNGSVIRKYAWCDKDEFKQGKIELHPIEFKEISFDIEEPY